jgi:hypothetical protein
MKYFEKVGSKVTRAARKLLTKSIDKEEAYAKIDKIVERRRRLGKIEDRRPKFFEKNVEAIAQRKSDLSKVRAEGEIAVSQMRAKAKLASAPVHPMQGTMLNVQTRESQRKYKSKILGKKRADILVPLWN